MIDKVRLYTQIHIPIQLLTNGQPWYACHSRLHGSTHYRHYCNAPDRGYMDMADALLDQRRRGLELRYYPNSQRLFVIGKLMHFSIRSDLVSNLDLPYAGISDVQVSQHHETVDGQRQITYCHDVAFEDLPVLLDKVSRYISDLVGQRVDIRTFQVSYIEICFNVRTGHAEEYLELFNGIMRDTDPKRYQSYVLEHGLSPGSSFYVTPRRRQESRPAPAGKEGRKQASSNKSRTIVNFYNKTHQILQLVYDTK